MPAGGAEPVSDGPDGPSGPPAEGSPLRPPAHSCSAVFDEDKPIASSGAYNLDFDGIEPAGRPQASGPRAPPPEAGPPAGEPDGAPRPGEAEAPEAGDGGSLRRAKKPRPPSLKRKPPPKKAPEAAPAREAPPGGRSPGPGEEHRAPEAEAAPAAPEPPGPAAPPQAAAPAGAEAQDSPPVGRKALPPAPAPAPSGEPEDPPARGPPVRLEFDYSEDSAQDAPPAARKPGRKPAAKMPLRRPKARRGPEKLDGTPASPPRSPAEPGDLPVAKGSYTFDIDKWDDPDFNPFSSTPKMQESPKLPPPAFGFTPGPAGGEPAEPPAPGSPAQAPASFEIPVGGPDADGDGLGKPAKKKKTPLKT